MSEFNRECHRFPNLVYPHSKFGTLKVLSRIKAKVIIRQFFNADFENEMIGKFINLTKSDDPKKFFSSSVLKNGFLDKDKLVEAAIRNEKFLR